MRVCEPIPSATARRRVVSEIRIIVANVPSATVVRRRTTVRRPLAESSTGTPPRAGNTRPLTSALPPPTRRFRAVSVTDVVVPAPPPVPGPCDPHEPTT